jgi:hypothetical protein
MLSLVMAASAGAQTSAGPNSGALTFTGGLDVPTIYFFRGIRQETKPTLTLWPYGDIGLALMSGDGGLKRVAFNFGVWNSLQTGSSGTNGPSGRLHYEEDFYTTLNLGFGEGVAVGTTFTAITSPNAMFNTIKELSLKISKTHKLAPYATVAFELTDSGQADGGQFVGGHKGTYFELGARPRWPLGVGKATLAVPVKVGLSLKDYYEKPDGTGDSKFGFFDVGGLVTFPLTGISSQFGSWNLHGSADYILFGDTTEMFNVDKNGKTKKNKVLGLLGIGLTY